MTADRAASLEIKTTQAPITERPFLDIPAVISPEQEKALLTHPALAEVELDLSLITTERPEVGEPFTRIDVGALQERARKQGRPAPDDVLYAWRPATSYANRPQPPSLSSAQL